MNYYIDCEFLEGSQLKRFWGIPYAKTKPTIDLISIGIVCEDGREYYAISKDFNLEEAWNRFDWVETGKSDLPGINRSTEKRYWIRDNVLRLIWNENYIDVFGCNTPPFCYEGMKVMISKIGKRNDQIAHEVLRFVMPEHAGAYDGWIHKVNGYMVKDIYLNPQFYGYYSDYDWVVFCWLFGKMIDLPKGFQMYCRDLKQELDKEVFSIWLSKRSNGSTISFEEQLSIVKSDPRYPKQVNKHNALADARWNKGLHRFIMAT